LDGVLAHGDSGVGFTLRFEPSPYRGSDRDYDLLPLFIHESRHFYLQGKRTGLKLEREAWRAELILQERLEGFASDQVPTSMSGMAKRSLGADLGIGLQRTWGRGTAYGELLHDVSTRPMAASCASATATKPGGEAGCGCVPTRRSHFATQD
jgi:outer membrane scaffolding protein for murein synthesis (MipA/OmpV family)